MNPVRWFLVFVLCVPAFAQRGTIPAFVIERNPIELSRLAQPNSPFDKVGRKFALLGTESGTAEAWAYPLKLLRNFELSFLIRSSTEPIRARDVVRSITARPEATTITYTFQSFTVRAHFVTPVDVPGALVLLDIQSTEPLTVIGSFLPVLQPMWPAGLGGQYAYWDEAMAAYLISEPTRKNHGFIGSPAAEGMSYTPAHMLSDFPNQFKIECRHPDSLRGRFIPIVLAGGKGNRDSVKAAYRDLAANPERYYRRTLEHYRSLSHSTMQVKTPNHDLNVAFEWAKVAYDNLFVDNPDLGFGMIAGLGISGTGGRPGFGWFFGGDAFINAFSLNSYGAFQSTRDALAFTQKWQREDGKMAHELSQAAGYINWWKDYPYGYIHGDTSPFFICAVYDYYLRTGDTAFVRESWNALRKAYEWSRSTDANNDGLMDNKKAGLGALEYGPLTDIQSDVYTGAVWARAAQTFPLLAEAAGDYISAQRTAAYADSTRQAFNEKFWDERKTQYSYAFTAKGKHVDIVSPWSSVGLMWKLGDPRRSEQSLEKLNSAELTTDWGIRSISDKSKYFEALNYNYGAVWPFLTSWVSTAQYKHHFALQGFNSLMASVRHTFDNNLGMITEVFSGAQNIWPQEAVSHQGFCTAGVVLPFVRGMLGLESDVPAKRIAFAPHLPANWQTVSAMNVVAGPASLSCDYTRERNRIVLRVHSDHSEGYRFAFAPALGAGTTITAVRVNGIETTSREERSSQTVQPVVEFALNGSDSVEVTFTPTVELLPPTVESQTGDANRGLKIVTSARIADRIQLTVDGLAGERYAIGLVNADLASSVTGGTLDGDRVILTMPNGPVGAFVRHQLTVVCRTR